MLDGAVPGRSDSTVGDANARLAGALIRRLITVAVAVVFASFMIGGTAGASGPQDGVPPPDTPAQTDPPPEPVPAPEPEPAPLPPPDPFAKFVNHLHVDLGHQRVNAIANDGTLLRSMPASTGAGGATPPGTYAVYSKSASTVATSNRAVTMPWMTRFRGGIGFHGIPRKNGRPIATPLGEAPVSHGCVRLADEDAAWIYDTIPMGMQVIVK